MFNVEVDMHTHSCYSDGYDNPYEIVKKAKEKGLKAICLTDHDVFHGLPEFIQATSDFGIDGLPGIEITSKYKGVDVHILGYGINYSRKTLLDKRLRKHWEAGQKRIKQMLKKYKEASLMEVDIQELRKKTNCKGPVIFPVHIRKYRFEVSDISFMQVRNEILKGGVTWVDVDDNLLMSPVEAVNFIKEIDGLAVLAHPGEFCYRTNKKPKESLLILFEVLDDLQKAGLFGIEAYHPKHTSEQAKLFVRLAKGRKLFVTGGSDYHGNNATMMVGSHGITYKEFLYFKKCLVKK
ncbi:PHP domain-containing protein [bacterium]|nr:PHP domain-containing protein [bacterium]